MVIEQLYVFLFGEETEMRCFVGLCYDYVFLLDELNKLNDGVRPCE
jgi:hypothetical protein